MTGKARLIGSISGRASATGGVTAKATIMGSPYRGIAQHQQPIRGSGERTRDTGLYHWLTVTPTEPQHLVWLTPQVGIDYQIETSTDLKWQIK